MAAATPRRTSTGHRRAEARATVRMVGSIFSPLARSSQGDAKCLQARITFHRSGHGARGGVGENPDLATATRQAVPVSVAGCLLSPAAWSALASIAVYRSHARSQARRLYLLFEALQAPPGVDVPGRLRDADGGRSGDEGGKGRGFGALTINRRGGGAIGGRISGWLVAPAHRGGWFGAVCRARAGRRGACVRGRQSRSRPR